MDRSKFDRLVREFPFLEKIFLDGKIFSEQIENIQVRQADRNLLEVRPGSWYFDAGNFGSGGRRNFWIVCPGEVIRLKDSSYKDVAYVGGGYIEDAGLIANQLIELLDREISYIIEISSEGYDWDLWTLGVVIYKMKNLDWRRFCRPQQVAQK